MTHAKATAVFVERSRGSHRGRSRQDCRLFFPVLPCESHQQKGVLRSAELGKALSSTQRGVVLNRARLCSRPSVPGGAPQIVGVKGARGRSLDAVGRSSPRQMVASVPTQCPNGMTIKAAGR